MYLRSDMAVSSESTHNTIGSECMRMRFSSSHMDDDPVCRHGTDSVLQCQNRTMRYAESNA